MDFIKQWALGLVAASIIGTVVIVLSPSGSIEKQVKTVVSLFMLIAFLYPFLSGIDFESNFEEILTYKTSTAESDISATVANQMKNKLQENIKETLSQHGIKTKEINIDITINDDEMKINGVSIVLDKNQEEMQSQAKRVIEESFDIVVETEVEN